MSRLWDFSMQLDLKGEKAMYIQIVDAIITAIKNKRLKSGEILPSSRKLAAIIGVNRNTVIKSQDILIAEGWLVSKDRIGVFVAEIMIGNNRSKVQKVESLPTIKRLPIIIDDGIPNTQIAPIKELASAYRSVFNLKSKRNILGYTDSRGSVEFRNIIAQMLNHKRGMRTTSDQICITRGSQMALYLIAHSLLTQKDIVLVENPGYRPAWKAFESAGAKILPVSVDGDGIKVDEVEVLVKKYTNIKAIYITPHHQYPTTVTLNLKRRLSLIELSNTYNFTIIEDDYDHEFHFDRRPVLPISSFSGVKNYAYIGTFSKIVAPSLRIGFLTCGLDLIQKIASLREIIDIQNDSIMEQAIVELIKNGDVKRHLKRAAKYYKDKRIYFDKLLKTHLKDKIQYTFPSGGLAFWIKPLKPISIPELLKKMEMSNIQISDSSKYSFGETIQGFRFGYASVSKDELKKVVVRLNELL